MLDNVSILITGNPVSSSGFTEIGKVGTGLVATDPEWPVMAEGDYVVIVTEKDDATVYCLMFNSSLISSVDSCRSGVLNFQLKIPFGKAIADSDGNKVSPFKFLQNVFNAYKNAEHLISYPGVEGWNFSGDGIMTAEEFDKLCEPFYLVDNLLPPRHLTGDGEAFIVMDELKLEAITLDYAYREVTKYAKLILTPKGIGGTKELASLSVPRRPVFEVYVNHVLQKPLVKEGDGPFELTVTPAETYKLPKTITVDFAKAKADRLIDVVNERIDYNVKFDDRKETINVKVRLVGCEEDREHYQRLMKELLDGIELRSQQPGFKAAATKDVAKGQKQFIISGLSTTMSYEVKYGTTPQNVKFLNRAKISSGVEELEFQYEKPVPVGKTAEKPKNSNFRRNGGGIISVNPNDESVADREPRIISIPVHLRTKAQDVKLLDKLRDVKFDLQLTSSKSKIALSYDGIRCKHRQEISIKKHGSEIRNTGSIDVFTSFLQDNLSVEVSSDDPRFEMYADIKGVAGNRRDFDPRIIITAMPVSAIRVMKPKIIKWAGLVLLFALGWFVGEYWHPISTLRSLKEEKTDDNIVVTDTILGAAEQIVQDTPYVYGSSVSDNTGGTEMTDSHTEVNPESSVLPEAERKRLSDEASRHLQAIKGGNLAFIEAVQIQKWVNDNKSNSVPISGYNNVAAAIPTVVQAASLLQQIKTDFDSGLPQRLNAFIKKMPSKGDLGPILKQLRTKMQKLNDGNKASDEDVAQKIYNLAEKYPTGLTSFALL